jgi:hypothetical protein
VNPWTCALLIAVAGACGGFINALLSDNGFLLPRLEAGIWCLGALSNILAGAFAAFASWACYGAGAGVELGLATLAGERNQISLRFSALAGALLVGVAGAKWITSQSDKLMLKESVKSISARTKSREECERLIQGSARQVLRRVRHA